MLYRDNPTGPLVAVSFDSTTYNDLKFFLNTKENVDVERIDPLVFMESVPDPSKNYINLATAMPLRKNLVNFFNKHQCKRFSYTAEENCLIDFSQSNGCFFYPVTYFYPKATLGTDIIMHSSSGVAHGSYVGSGCFFSGGVIVCGSVKIGNHCWFGANSTVVDQITVADETVVSAGSVVHKNVEQSGMNYVNGRIFKQK